MRIRITQLHHPVDPGLQAIQRVESEAQRAGSRRDKLLPLMSVDNVRMQTLGARVWLEHVTTILPLSQSEERFVE
jgi:hypothetical protein